MGFLLTALATLREINTLARRAGTLVRYDGTLPFCAVPF